MKIFWKFLPFSLILLILIPRFSISQTNSNEFVGVWKGERFKINIGSRPEPGATASLSIFPTPEPWILMDYENPPHNQFEIFKGKIEDSQLIGNVPNVKFRQSEQAPFLKLRVEKSGFLTGSYRSRLGEGTFPEFKKIANLPQPVILSPKELKSFNLPDYKIMPAEGEFATLGREWVGKFQPAPLHKFVIKRIEGDKVQAIYAWNMNGKPGYSELDGIIRKEGNFLHLSFETKRQIVNYYFLTETPERLYVTWEDKEKGWLAVAVLQKEK